MNSQEYWKKRTLYAKQKELDNSAEFEEAMRYRLKSLENEFVKEAKKYISKYAETNDISKKEAAKILASIDVHMFGMTLVEFETKARAGGHDKELNSIYYKTRIARLKQLYSQYQKLAGRYATKEEDRLSLGLAEQYNQTYLLGQYNRYSVISNMDVNLTHFDEQQLKNIVYQPWQGSDFSKRIWRNYTEVLPEVLTDRLLRATLMGYSASRAEKDLRDAFQTVAKKDLHRLIVTEMGHIAEQATLKFYEDSSIEKYQYLATLESHTCGACRVLDGKIFLVGKEVEGVNYPLIHPYCRCSTMPYIKDLPPLQSRWYRNPITGKGGWVDNMTFKQWQEANGVKPINKQKFFAAKKPVKLLNEPVKPKLSPLSTRVSYVLGEETSERIMKVFNKAPLNMQRLYDKYRNKVVIEDIVGTGASFFLPATNKLTFNHNSFNQKWREEMSTFFHEVGHLIDYNSKIGGSKKQYATVEKSVSDYMLDDWTNDKVAKEIERLTTEGLRDDEIGEFNDGSKYVKATYRPLRLKKDGTLYKADINKIAKATVYDANVELVEKLKTDVKKNGIKGYSGLSDALDAVTKSRMNLGIGHFGNYYKGEDGKQSMGKEFFANYCSALVHDDKNKDLMRKYFPKAAKACDEIIKEELGEE